MTDASPTRRKPPAGWYAHPQMAGTRRYWDGDDWTDHVAPVEVAPVKTLGALTIARGVALGIAGLVGIVWVVNAWMTSGDATECAIRNAERAMDQRSGPAEVCPD